MGEKDATRRIAAAREGRNGAADELFEGYRNYLRFLARDGVGGALQPKVDASDVVQDVLIRARDKFAQFRGETEPQLLGWLRQILARRIVDLARQHKVGGDRGVIHERSIDEVIYESSQAFGKVLELSGTSPSHNAMREEQSTRIADALARLSDDHAQVIQLRTMRELEWKEVADRMGRSYDAVQKLWFRALRKLRPLLKESS
jgi:RNA polymerase sigma-70 factor (ECF subfamily)